MSKLLSATKQVKMAVLMTMLAGLSMGNESCSKANERVLKMDVDIGPIAAQPITMPSGEKIDFGYISNALFYQSITSNDHFVISNAIPTPASTLSNNMAASKASLAQKLVNGLGFNQSNDEKVLGEFGFLQQLQTKASKMANVSAAAKDTAADIPTCLYTMPAGKLAGEIVSFEANWGGGLSVGYGANGAISNATGVGGNVTFNNTRLQMGLRIVDPLSNQLVTAAEGVSNQSNIKFGVNLASILLGLDFVYKTPIASVVSGAFDKSLSTLVTNISKAKSSTSSWGDAWESRVVYDPVVANGDTQIVIRGGTRYGMLVGDQFTITNMRYLWSGPACTSPLVYKVPMSATPIANVTVVAVGDNVAVAHVDKYLADESILPGAQVKLLKMLTTSSK